jgi:hypothetical protein
MPDSHRPCLLVTDALETPIPSQVKWEADQLSVTILDKEGAVGCRVHALVTTSAGGAVLLPTVWLFPQWRPYRLELEILRGLISRLRRGCDLWQNNGLPVPETLPRSLRELTHGFIEAWHDQSRTPPIHTLRQLLDLGLQLLPLLPNSLAISQGCDFFQPRFPDTPRDHGTGETEDRSPGYSGNKFGMGVRVERLTPTVTAADAEVVPGQDAGSLRPHWRELTQATHLKWVATGPPWKDWPAATWNGPVQGPAVVEPILADLRQAGQRIIWGPALAIQEDCLPSGLKIGADGEWLVAALGEALRQRLPEIASHCDIVHLVSGLNAVGVAGLTPTIQYHLVRAALELTAQVAPSANAMISFSQPLGERLGWSVGGQHPDQFLSKLAKEHVPIQVLGLELDLGYFPFGTLPRDPLQWVMELQRWSVWGVPILIYLRVPSRPSSDAKRKVFAPGGQAIPSPESQRQFLIEFARLLSALPWIHGIVYNQWQDNDSRFADAGLVDDQGYAKPILRRWLLG